jgi:hypothetical protein
MRSSRRLAVAKRIQMSRQRPWRAEHPDAVIVARRGRYGNPFKVGDPGVPDRQAAVDMFRRFLNLRATHPGMPSSELFPGQGIPDYPSLDEIRLELAGRDLACWCPLTDADGNPVPCHADVLLELTRA